MKGRIEAGNTKQAGRTGGRGTEEAQWVKTPAMQA